ncbi:TonB-dependent receptor [Altererythrobacter sp. MF3-039]|uniref:TonB-dependent receptor n=1 Tax=Altererythrobacter sp. MF3-039 TaxID=3252901 RepID=UPI00390C4D70
MKFSSRNLLMCASAPLALGIAASPAFAQDAQDTTIADADEISGNTIIVTARKREETLLEVPVAITAYGEEAIEDAGFQGLEDISLQSSGFQFSNQGGQQPGRYNTQLRFRGMSTSQFSPTFATGAFFIDGVYILNGGTSNSLVDVERVEVIKGPQSAYFGRNTFGGAVNFITRNPSLTEFNGQVETSVDSRGTFDLSGIVEIPVIEDQLSISLSGRYYDKRGHYVANDGGRLGNEETMALNGVVYWEPTPNLYVKLRASYTEDSDGAPAGAFVAGRLNDTCTGTTVTTGAGETAMPVNYICGGLPGPDDALTENGGSIISSNTAVTQFFLDSIADATLPPGVPSIDRVGMERRTERYSAKIGYEFDSGYSIDVLAALNEQGVNWIRDFDLTDNIGWFSRDPQSIEDKTFEARFTSPQDQRLRWMVGINYYEQDFITSGGGGDASTGCFVFAQTFDYADCVIPLFFPNSFTQTDTSEVLGIFGAVDFDITDTLTLILEGRYQDDTLTKGGVPTAGGVDDSALDLTSKAFLPRFILRYQPNPDTNLYFSYAEGILQGDINTFLSAADAQELAQYQAQLPSASVILPEEKLDAWEIGLKQSLMGNKLQINLSAYYYEWENIKGRSTAVINETCDAAKLGEEGCTFPGVQLGDVAQIDDGMGGLTPFFNSRNTLTTGSAELYGIELESSAVLSDNWTAQLNVTWAKNEYTDYEFNFVEPFAGFSDQQGNQQPRFPEWSGNFSTTYTDTFTQDWDWYARGDVIYFGEAFVDESNLAFTEDYFLVNARVGLERDGMRIEAFVRNLFDEDAWAAGARWTDFSTPTFFPTLTAFQGVAVTPQDRRTVGLRVIADF